MKKYTLRFAVIIFGLSLVFGLTFFNKSDYRLFGVIENNINLSLEKHLAADLNGFSTSYKDTAFSYLSDVTIASFPFSSLAFDWEQKTPDKTSVDMEVRFFNGLEWGDWYNVLYEEDQTVVYEHSPNDYYKVNAIINTTKSESFQYRINLKSDSIKISPEFKNLKFTYINANDEPFRKNLEVLSGSVFKAGSKITSSALNTKGIKYISRAGWSANEDLRLYKNDNPEPVLVNLSDDFYIKFAKELKLQKIITTSADGNTLTWPLQYSEKVDKIIIHHTATEKDLDDPAKAIRDIYYYHTIAKGWGDIGYNYIIDQQGNVYEGRYGGEGVVGAHAGPGNRGTIGIAILGNFNSNELPPQVQKSLETLISDKTKIHGINPTGESYFRSVKLPNIIGHNAVMSTSCPGTNILLKLDEIRKNIAKLNKNFDYSLPDKKNNKEFSFEYLATLDEIKMKPDKKMYYIFKLKNTGTKSWDNKTQIKFEGNKFVNEALSVSGSKLKETSVKPGGTGTFTLEITSKMKGGFNYIPLKTVFNGNIEADEEFYIPSVVEAPFFAYEFVDISIPKSVIQSGEQIIATVTLKNTGNVKWRNFGENRISLGSSNPQDRISAFTKSTRMGYLIESVVNPGETGQFIFNLKAPKKPGVYEEFFTPVIEKISWLPQSEQLKLSLNVKS